MRFLASRDRDGRSRGPRRCHCAPSTRRAARVQDVGNRRPQQELRQLLRGVAEQLGEQVRHDRGPPGELGHCGRDVGAILEPRRRPAAGRRTPALGVTPQLLELTRRQAMLAERGEQLDGLGQRQRQITLAELGEPAPAPP